MCVWPGLVWRHVRGADLWPQVLSTRWVWQHVTRDRCVMPLHVTGMCSNGTCLCTNGWNGKHCTMEGCPGNCGGHGTCSMPNYKQRWECLCESGWYGPGCDIRLEQNCDDRVDNDKGELEILISKLSAQALLVPWLTHSALHAPIVHCKNMTPLFQWWWCYRRPCGLWGSWVLWGPSMWALPAVPHCLRPNRHSSEEAASRSHSLLLREDEVHHRGPRPSELRQEEGVQWKVGAASCDLGLTVSLYVSLCLAVHITGGKILISGLTSQLLASELMAALPCTNSDIVKAHY